MKNPRCVYMALGNGGVWRAGDCLEPRFFLCQAPKSSLYAPSTTPFPPITDSHGKKLMKPCSFGSTSSYSRWYQSAYNSDVCYMASTYNDLDFYDAENFCERQGGNLVSIHDGKQNDEVLSFLRSVLSNNPTSDKKVWIGIRLLRHAQTYQWEDESPVDYVHLRQRSGYERRSCHVLDASDEDGFWRDESCARRHKFLCKKDRSSSIPTTTQTALLSTTSTPIANCESGWAQYKYSMCLKVSCGGILLAM